ncbi:MAG: T9SS type A sorting domain-containing protein [Candidatus Kapaibacterium sp.]
MKKSLHFCLIALVMIAAGSTASAQLITFSAVDSLTQKPLTLDSIRIINPDYEIDTTITGNIIDLGELTSVDEKNEGTFPLQLTSQGKELRLYYPRNYSLRITDVSGRAVFESPDRIGSLNIDLNSLSTGNYYMRLVSADKSLTRMIQLSPAGIYISGGEKRGVAEISKDGTIEQFEGFTFTAYRKGFRNKVLTSTDINNADEILFELQRVLPPFDHNDFSIVELKLTFEGFTIETHEFYSYWDSAKKTYEIINYEHSITLNNIIVVDTYTNCMLKYDGDSYIAWRQADHKLNKPGVNKIKLTIDRDNQLITDLFVCRYHSEQKPPWQFTYLYKTYFSNLTYEDQGDHLLVNIKNNELFEAMTFYDEWQHGAHINKYFRYDKNKNAELIIKIYKK